MVWKACKVVFPGGCCGDFVYQSSPATYIQIDHLKLTDTPTNTNIPVNNSGYYKNFEFYPNPVENTLTIKGFNAQHQYRIIVFSAEGRNVMEQTIDSAIEPVVLNTLELQDGHYHLVIKKSGRVVFSETIIK